MRCTRGFHRMLHKPISYMLGARRSTDSLFVFSVSDIFNLHKPSDVLCQCPSSSPKDSHARTEIT